MGGFSKAVQERNIKHYERQGFSRAEAELKAATYSGKDTFKFLDPALDFALGLASAPTLVIKKAAEQAAEEHRARSQAKNIARIQDRINAEAIAKQDALWNASLPPADTFPLFTDNPQVEGGGVPVSFLTQLGQGLMQQTAAVRHAASKAAGRRGGKKSSAKKKRRARASTRRQKNARASTRRKGHSKMTKGSAAAKAWGKRMSALRKKK